MAGLLDKDRVIVECGNPSAFQASLCQLVADNLQRLHRLVGFSQTTAPGVAYMSNEKNYIQDSWNKNIFDLH